MQPCSWSAGLVTSLAALLTATGCGVGVASLPAAEELSSDSSALVSALPAPLVARKTHQVALRDGKVLLIGGAPTSTPSVEIFDPATNTFAAGPALLANRRAHRLVTLNDGSLLVLGGIDSASVIASVEKLAPGATAWQAMAPMPAAVYGHTATVLADGRVLVAGGVGYRASAWLYDPATNVWTTTGSLATGRMGHAAVRLPDGRVLIAGGSQAGTSTPLASAELFNPTTGTWSATGAMREGRNAPTMAIAGGRVLVTGGTTLVDRYEVTTGTFAAEGSTAVAHYDGTLLGLADGSAIVMGDTYQAQIERLPAGSSTWQVVDSMPATRNAVPLVQLADGRVIVTGGRAYPVGGGNEFARADAFAWTLSTSSCVPRTCASVGATCGSVSNGCGGTLSCGTCGSGQVCGTSNTCVSACTPTTCAAAGVTCGTLADGCGGVLTCGGACAISSGTVTATTSSLKVPRCATVGSACVATTTGRASIGPEVGAPNTLGTCADGASGSFHVDESVDGVRVRSVSGGPLTAGGAAQVEVDVWAYTGFSSDLLDVYVTSTPSSPTWTLVATRTATKAGAQTLIVPLTLPNTGATTVAVRAQFRYGGSSASACTSGSYNDRDDLVFAVAPTGLQNPGFESGLASWTAVGDVSAGLTGGYQSNAHAVLKPTVGATTTLSQAFVAGAAATQLRFFVKPESFTQAAVVSVLNVTVVANGVTAFSGAVVTNIGAGSWMSASAPATVPAGATVQVTFSATTSAVPGELFRIDGVSFQ